MAGLFFSTARTMLFSLALTACTVGAASQAHAEAGDYSALQTIVNLVSPPPADNPVTPAQMQGPFPLLPNPSGVQ